MLKLNMYILIAAQFKILIIWWIAYILTTMFFLINKIK